MVIGREKYFEQGLINDDSTHEITQNLVYFSVQEYLSRISFLFFFFSFFFSAHYMPVHKAFEMLLNVYVKTFLYILALLQVTLCHL